MTPTAQEIIDWIEGRNGWEGLRVPEGKLVGKPVVLESWQKDIIVQIYDNPHNTRRAIISFGRKNGKTALSAMLLLAHLCGPVHRKNSQLYSAAQSRDQAAILFGLGAKMVRMSEDLSSFVGIRESAKSLFCDELGTVYRALSADATTAYGLSSVFVVHDELGQVRGERSELYEAIETGMSAHDSPLSIVISTQAPTDNDLLSRLIDDAEAGNDPRVILGLWTAPEDADPFDVETVKLANPAFGVFQNEQEIMDMAATASRMPSRESEFRNLILNQRVETNDPLISPSVWAANSGDPVGWGPVFGGLDLSETNDLTAFVLVSPFDGLYGVKSTFWLPQEGLSERSHRDRVPYDLWHQRGFLSATPGRSVSYEYVAAEIVKAFSEYDVRKIAFDRWNMRHLKPWLVKAGLTETFIDEHFVEFGQGWASMSPAIRTRESMLLDGEIRHSNHPVLTMCASNAIAKGDEAGNRKLDKKRSTGRIDGLVALTMAVATAAEMMSDPVYPIELGSVLEA